MINIQLLTTSVSSILSYRRTVVVGDCPWVAQAAEAFLSKIFACSYSIAGLNVLSGNPADHHVHRHTHRVVRGSLLICGRPDGRLPALTSLEGVYIAQRIFLLEEFSPILPYNFISSLSPSINLPFCQPSQFNSELRRHV
jgi:hypothetical protein